MNHCTCNRNSVMREVVEDLHPEQIYDTHVVTSFAKYPETTIIMKFVMSTTTTRNIFIS